MAFSKVILNDEVLMDVTDDTVAETNLLSGEQATGNDGEKVEGSIATKTASDLTASGATVTVPAGYYASQATKSVSTTTHPKPTVSLNSSTGLVTASHTQTTGYVTGGTTKESLVLTTQGGKTVTPTESAQTAVAAGWYTTGAVTVAAIPSDYIGSGVIQNDSDDLTVSGRFVTAPAGYYAEDATKGVAVGSSVVNAEITTTPSISVNSTTGVITATAAGTASVTPTVSPGYVSAGTAGNINYSGSASLQLTTQAAKTVTPTESEQTAVAKNVYTTGIVKVGAISSTYIGSDISQNDSDDLTASGATVTTPAGYYAEDASKTIASGSATVSSTITISPTITVSDSGKITAKTNGSVGVKPTVTAGYISEGTTGTITYTGNSTTQLAVQAATTVTPTESPQTAVAAKRYTTGAVTVAAIPSDYIGSSITHRNSDDLTVSWDTIIAPAGYYAEDASKTIAAGSASTPATTISINPVNSIDYANATITSTVDGYRDITPSVVSGYISSGTAGRITVTGSKNSVISTKTSNIVPTSETQVITPNTTGTMFHNIASTNYGTNSSSSLSWAFVDGTQYIFDVTLRAINRSTSDVYEELTYKSLITWDGAWSAPILPKGSAAHYPVELTFTSTSYTVKWNETNSDTSFYFSVWVYEVASANSFMTSVTVYPIPKFNELVSLLSNYDIVTEGASMNDVYNNLVSFFAAIEAGGYTYGSALLESAGNRLMTADSDILNDDQRIKQTNNGDGTYTISYK